MFVCFAAKPLRFFYRALYGCVALVCMGAPTVFATEIDFAVMISATPQTSPPRITLTWPAHASATEYRISRKLSAATSFTTLTTVTTGSATLTSYVDNAVTVGTGYEYEVRRLISGNTVYGYGYIASAINLPLVENRGKLVLLVDDTMATPLATELTLLEADLRGDGWTVLRHDVSRAASVTSVKALIKTAYDADSTNVKAVFLFGRIPVPYSGDIAPDAHSDHQGAWPADCYYGEMNGNWTDTSVNNVTSTKYGTRNHNIPGDGKFDQSGMPGLGNSRIELMVGRVDLSSLPAYTTLTETQLLKRYLDKDNAWRQGTLTVNRRGLVDENFDLTEKFAAGGFRMLGALFGAANTSALDYTGTLSSNAYLASYGDGAGDTSSCSGVVTTGNFAANDYRTVFTFLFGSYFGDWDSSDNLLRAALGSPTYTLASTWSSRPYPLYHTLGMGDPIGAGVRLTQNFSGNEFSDIYKPSYTTNFNFDDDVHVALMGDPTLRLHPVKPATNLQQTTSTSPSQVALTWTASADTSIVGYHVYRATSATGSLTRLTGTSVTTSNPAGSAITGTTYTDTTTTNGTTYQYMVRAVKLETSNTGTYYNFSQGAFVTNAPPVITASQSPTGTVGTAFSYQVVASNTPTSYALASGTLPPGVALNTTTGLLSGTPTTVGTYTPSFTAANGTGTSPAVVVTITIAAPGSLIVSEPLSYTVGANNPDPDAGLNTSNGLPATNVGGSPSGTSTGLRGTWGTTTDVVTGLAYVQGSKTLTTSGGAGRVNNATWGGQPYLYQGMSTDPFLLQRIGSVNNGNLGVNGTSLYVSLIASTSSAAADAFRFSFKYDGTDNFYVSNTATGWSLNGTTATGATLALDTPTLLVLRFDFAAGAASTVSLWVNPTLGAALGTANAVRTAVNFPGFSNFQTRAAVANAMTFDELRVGTTFDVVTPFTDSAVAPVVTASQSSSGAVGSAFSYQVLASNTPTSYSNASGLPPGVTLNTTTGLLTGTPSAAGTYTPSFTATNTGGTSPAVVVTLTIAPAPTGLETFRTTNSLAADGSQDLLTPAGDGVQNLLKYVFNMIGNGTGQGSNLNAANSSVITANGSAGLPLVDVDGTGKLRVTHVRRKSSSNSGISYIVEFSDTLANGTWAVNTSATTNVTSVDELFERVVVTDNLTSATKRFVRVRVTIP